MPNYGYRASTLNPTLMPGSQPGAFSGIAGAPGGINQAQQTTAVTDRIRDLATRVKAGDPSAIAEVQQLVQADLDHTDDPVANWARDISNSFLGTDFKSRYDKSGMLHDLLPGIAVAGGALALGLLAPAAGAGALGSSGGFGTAGMAGATGASAGVPAALGGGIAATGPGGLGGSATTTGVNAAGAAGGGVGAGAAGGVPAALGGGVSGAGGLLGTIGKYGPLVAGGLGAIGAGKLGSQAEGLRNQAAQMAIQDYNDRKPLRTAAMAGLTGPQAQKPDLGGLFSDPSNPYKRSVYGTPPTNGGR